MRIRQLELGDDGTPDKITAELTRDEALYLATLLVENSDAKADELMPGGAAIKSDLFGCLTGELFNRYWSGGALEALMKRATA